MLALFIAFATAFPSFARLLVGTVTEIKRLGLDATHHEIDAACDAAQAAPWVCPAACPLRALRLHDTGTAGSTLPKAS